MFNASEARYFMVRFFNRFQNGPTRPFSSRAALFASLKAIIEGNVYGSKRPEEKRMKNRMALTLIALLACTLLVTGCASGPTSNAHSTSAASAGASSSNAAPNNAEGETYTCAYFTVELPPSWGHAWSMEEGSEYREAMNATNYSYTFIHDGVKQFRIDCNMFNLDSTAEIGSTGKRIIELHPTPSMSPEDESFVRLHIKVKQE